MGVDHRDHPNQLPAWQMIPLNREVDQWNRVKDKDINSHTYDFHHLPLDYTQEAEI